MPMINEPEEYCFDSLSSTLNILNSKNLIEIAKEEGRLSPEQEKKLLNYAIKSNKCSVLIEYAYAMHSKLPEEMHNFVVMNSGTVTLSYFKLLNKLKSSLKSMASVVGDDSTLKQVIEEI